MVNFHINIDRPPMANPAVISRSGLDDYLILVNCDTGESLSLNKTGKMVWDLIKEGKDTAGIISAIRNRFKNVPESVSDEVGDLITLFAQGGFIGYEMD